jgi:ubiquinone/menaquinone biosynthesis C-methylase UbiE
MKKYSQEPENAKLFTEKADALYTRFAGFYDLSVKYLPVWKTWLKKATPHIEGPRVLEVSFGTGYLMTRYADSFETYGIDYNYHLARTALDNLSRKKMQASLFQGNVESLPFKNDAFDSIVNTMALSGYPDGIRAMGEMLRVLRSGGKLVMIDVNYPKNSSWLGNWMAKGWAVAGDIIRDMDQLFNSFNLVYTDEEIGGYGSVHLYTAIK